MKLTEKRNRNLRGQTCGSMDASFLFGLQLRIPLVVPVNTDVVRVHPVLLSLESLFEVFSEKCFRDNGIFF